MLLVRWNLWKLKSKAARVRLRAVAKLGKCKTAQAFEGLLSVRNDPDPHVRDAVAKALGEASRPDAVEPLLAMLNDPHPQVRETVAKALGKSGGPDAIEPLRAMLNDPDDDVRLHTGNALKELGWTPPDDASLVAWARATRNVQIAAARGDAIIEALRPLAAVGNSWAIDVLSRINSADAARALLNSSVSAKTWSWAFCQAYQRSGDPQLIQEALASSNRPKLYDALKKLQPPELRIKALSYILKIGDLEARENVFGQLEKLDQNVLEKPGEEGDVILGALIERLPQSPASVASVLANSCDQRAVAPLVQWLLTPGAGSKVEIAAALKKLRWRPETAQERAWLAAYLHDWQTLAAQDEAGAEAMIERLTELSLASGGYDRTSQKLAEIAGLTFRSLKEAITKLGPAAAPYVSHIKRLMRADAPSPAPHVFDLVELAGAVADETQDPELMWLVAAHHGFDWQFRRLAERGEVMVPWLVEGLRDPNPKIREQSIRALGETRASSAIEPLAQALAEPDPSIQECALKALREIGTAEAMQRVVSAWPAIHNYEQNLTIGVLASFVDRNPGSTPPNLACALFDIIARHGEAESRRIALAALGRVKMHCKADETVMVGYLMTRAEAGGDYGELRETAAGALRGRIGPEHAARLIQVIVNEKGEFAHQHVELLRDMLAGDAGADLPIDVLQSIMRLEDQYTYTYSTSYLGSPTGRESDEQWITEEETRCTDCVAIKQLAETRLREKTAR